MVGSDRPESKTLRKEFLLIDRNIRPAAGGAIWSLDIFSFKYTRKP